MLNDKHISQLAGYLMEDLPNYYQLVNDNGLDEVLIEMYKKGYEEAANEFKWIESNILLPLNDQFVLTYRNGAMAIRMNWYSTINKQWMMDNGRSDYSIITHWMKLPEPPSK